MAIRAAYLQKAKRYHPDINQSPQAEKLFKSIQEAYQILSDEAKKRDFDSSHEYSEDSSSTETIKERRTTRFKERIYDPEKERADFSREFYEQAEALRKEMENDQPTSVFREHAKKISSRLFWNTLPYILMSSIFFIVYTRWRSTSAWLRETSPVLHDMYGRGYVTDRFGRRIRAPRYDDKEKLSQWYLHRQSEKTLSLSDMTSDSSTMVDDHIGIHTEIGINSDVPSENKDEIRNRPRIKFQAFDRISARKRSINENEGQMEPPAFRPFISS